VPQREIPSLRAIEISVLTTPIVSIWLRSVLVVRSPLNATHESPRSVDRKTRCAAAIRTPGSCGERMNGVSQCQRFAGSSGVEFTVFALVGRMLFDSPVTMSRRTMFPPCDSAYTMRGLFRSGIATKPSPPRTWNQS